jgi:hypothetical protein
MGLDEQMNEVGVERQKRAEKISALKLYGLATTQLQGP